MFKTLLSQSFFRLLVVILSSLFDSVFLESAPELLREDPTSYSNQNTSKLNGDIDLSTQSRTLKHNPQIIHFPQTNYQPTSPLSSQWVPPRWFVTSSTSNTLREPANIPTVIYQDDARFLEKYMKNHFEEGEISDQQSKLNLASINHRAPKSDIPLISDLGARSITSNQQVQKRHDRYNSFPGSIQINNNPMSQLTRNDITRPDLVESGLSVKNGRVDDVALIKPHQATKFYPPSPAKQFLGAKMALLNKLEQNCVTKAYPFTSRCEDHLIRRLNQDATEGRTVVDVVRRVCCALFWHRDCISGIVVENCADSSPTATDFLMGSRKLDLTLSCQRFNRDGCNSAPGKSATSKLTILFSFVFTFFIIVTLSNIKFDPTGH